MSHHPHSPLQRRATLLALALVALLLSVSLKWPPSPNAPSIALMDIPAPTQPTSPSHHSSPIHHFAPTPPLPSQPPPLLAARETPTPGQPHRAFRLVLENGQCQVEAIEPVIGNFRPRRALPPLHTGMLLCRLHNAQGLVLAEDRLHPPDHACAVLDPSRPGSGPEPELVLLSGVGPQVIQARLPDHPDATTFEVLRVTASHPDLRLTSLLSLAVHP